MQIVTVAPIVRGVLRERLTYFSKEPLEVGMVIVVPIRSREIPAIVLETKTASDEKSTLKSSEYAIRKITRAHPRRIWASAFLRSVEQTATLTAQKFGEVLLSLTPKTILDAHLSGELPSPEDGASSAPNAAPHVLAIQNDTKTRLEHWERLVRESFARDESVYICLPTEEDVLRVAKKLERGISNYTFAFHSSMTKKRAVEAWKKVLSEKHAVLVIGTAQYLCLPRYFKTIVVDEEHSSAWKTVSRPLIDLRIFVENIARTMHSTLILGAPLLRAETHAEIARCRVEEFGRIAARTYKDIETSIVDPRAEEKAQHEATGRHNFVILTGALRSLIEKAHENKESIFLLAARKGLSPVTACSDCGTLIRCPECDTPLVIHKKRPTAEQKNPERTDLHIYSCHACGFMRAPENNVHETCPNCGGWKLQGLGIGIDRIEEELRQYFPDVPRFVLDGDRVKTRAQLKKLVAEFEKTPGSILLATPMALPYIDEISHAAIVSLDSLFAIPDIRMSERIFALVLSLREKTTNSLLIQTRADDTTIFTQALGGELMQFMENELSLRKTFSYPPFGTIIKISLRGKRGEIVDEIERVKIFLEDYNPIAPSTMSKEPKNIYRMHVILKLADGAWPNQNLLQKLRALPAQFTVEVNPSNLL